MTKYGQTKLTSRRAFLRNTAGAGLAVAAGTRIGPLHAATEDIHFQLDWIAFGRHAPYYTALEKGFYASKNLNVSIAQGSEPRPPALHTAMASALVCTPAMGAWTIGSLVPRSSRSFIRAIREV